MTESFFFEEKLIVGFNDELAVPAIQKFLKEHNLLEMKPQATQAHVIVLKDRSGSMGIWENYVSQVAYYWTSLALKQWYDTYTAKYISYSTEGSVVEDRSDFFRHGESGGTISSSAVKLCVDEVNTARTLYGDACDIYVLHLSDGDNLTSDNRRVVKMMEESILPYVTRYAYFEPNQYNRHSTMRSGNSGFPTIKDQSKFDQYVIHTRYEIEAHMTKHFKSLVRSFGTEDNLHSLHKLNTEDWF